MESGLGVQTVALTTLPRPLSIELLLRFRPEVPAEERALAGIAAELGDLPLALHLAGSFLERYAPAPFGQPAAYLESRSRIRMFRSETGLENRQRLLVVWARTRKITLAIQKVTEVVQALSGIRAVPSGQEAFRRPAYQARGAAG